MSIKCGVSLEGMGKELKSVLPLEAMYKFLTDSISVEIWERDGKSKHAGKMVGFDEYMNVTLESGEKRYVLKGDCICAIVAKE